MVPWTPTPTREKELFRTRLPSENFFTSKKALQSMDLPKASHFTGWIEPVKGGWLIQGAWGEDEGVSVLKTTFVEAQDALTRMASRKKHDPRN